MPSLQPPKAKQVSSLGESPAEARRRMQTSGGGSVPEAETRPPLGEEVERLTPEHMAQIREAEEGFSGGAVSGGTVEEAEETTAPPSPEKAMDMIRQLGQDKLQLQSELDAALAKVGRYERKYGELD